MQNANPSIIDEEVAPLERVVKIPAESINEPFTPAEIFEHIRRVKDPEHEMLTLEQLRVTLLENIFVEEEDLSTVIVQFTPTIPHCSMATLIGLCLSVKLMRSLPSRFKIKVMITPGTHASEHDINKQLADKERVAAALENPHLLKVVNNCIADSGRPRWAKDVYAHDELL